MMKSLAWNAGTQLPVAANKLEVAGLTAQRGTPPRNISHQRQRAFTAR